MFLILFFRHSRAGGTPPVVSDKKYYTLRLGMGMGMLTKTIKTTP